MALLVNPTNSILADTQSKDLQAAAATLGLKLHILHASTDRDFDAVFATLGQTRTGELMIGVDAFFIGRSEQLAALAVAEPRTSHGVSISRVCCRRRVDELRWQPYGVLSKGWCLYSNSSPKSNSSLWGPIDRSAIAMG